MKVCVSLLGLCVAVWVAAVESAPDCAVALATYRGCMGAAKRSELPNKRGRKKIELARDERKVKKSLCFQQNACFGDLTELAEDCKNKVLEKRIKRQLERCTKTDVTEILKIKKKRGGKSFLGQLKAVCPNIAAARKVRTCLGGVKKARRTAAGKERSGKSGHKRALRKAHTRCLAKVKPNSCRAGLRKDKKEASSTLCECAKKRIANNAVIDAEFEQCSDLLGPGALQEGEQEVESPLQTLVGQICHEGRLGNNGEKKSP